MGVRSLIRFYGLTEATLVVPDEDMPKLKKLVGAAVKAGHLPTTASAWISKVPDAAQALPKEPKAKKQKEPKQPKAKEMDPKSSSPETPWSGLASDLPAPKSATADLGDYVGDDDDYVSPFAHIIGKEKPASPHDTWAVDPNKMPASDGPVTSPKSMPNPTLHPKNISGKERAAAQSAWDSFAPKNGGKKVSNLSSVPRPIQAKKPGALSRVFGKGKA